MSNTVMQEENQSKGRCRFNNPNSGDNLQREMQLRQVLVISVLVKKLSTLLDPCKPLYHDLSALAIKRNNSFHK